MTEERFEAMLRSAAADAGVELRQIEAASSPRIIPSCGMCRKPGI